MQSSTIAAVEEVCKLINSQLQLSVKLARLKPEDDSDNVMLLSDTTVSQSLDNSYALKKISLAFLTKSKDQKLAAEKACSIENFLTAKATFSPGFPDNYHNIRVFSGTAKKGAGLADRAGEFFIYGIEIDLFTIFAD